ncbi:MAG TPA: hypothetical protein VGM56_09440 [Byssovorax sp.]
MSYEVERVTSSAGAAFDAAWGALDREFRPRGEIERREVVERWLARPGGVARLGDLELAYHLVAIDDGTSVVAARDHHVVVDRAARVVVVYLAHAWVAPAARRRGVGARLRAVAERDGEQARASIGGGELVLFAEMEPWEPRDAASTARLVAYGRAGFAAIDPARARYAQPDFRDLEALGGDARPIPLLAIVRRVGHDGARAMPADLAARAVRQTLAVYETHCRARDVAPIAARAELGIGRGRGVALVALPRSSDDLASLEALSAARVSPLYDAP